MLTHIRRIGNSQGIIIPAAILAACGLGSEVELRIEGRSLIIENPQVLRQGWFDPIPANAADQTDQELTDWDGLVAAESTEDWVW